MGDSVDREGMGSNQASRRWLIDFDWFEERRRSFSALAHSYLCHACRERIAEGVSAVDLAANIKDCCSQTPEFITGRQPIMESIFRLFLANGNQPLTLEELGEQLSERRGGDTYRTSAEILSRLISHDQYYGLRPVPESPAAVDSEA